MANLRTYISRYYLNYLWLLIDPILTMLILYLVFGVFLNQEHPNFLAFLFTVLYPWQWFANGVYQSSNSILANKVIMMQVNLPNLFYPLETILRGTFKHLFVLVLFLIFLASYPTTLSIAWGELSVLMIVQMIYIVAIGVLCAAIVYSILDLQFIGGES